MQFCHQSLHASLGLDWCSFILKTVSLAPGCQGQLRNSNGWRQNWSIYKHNQTLDENDITWNCLINHIRIHPTFHAHWLGFYGLFWQYWFALLTFDIISPVPKKLSWRARIMGKTKCITSQHNKCLSDFEYEKYIHCSLSTLGLINRLTQMSSQKWCIVWAKNIAITFQGIFDHRGISK